MAKSVINVLQEHCIKAHNGYPNYSIRDTSKNGSPLFTVECVLGNVRTTGIASSKIAAKTEAAEQMMGRLGIAEKKFVTSQCSLENQSPSTQGALSDNFVGALNEYCSKNGQPYPKYIEEVNGLHFATKCFHGELITTGHGSNKKLAKQESARAMFYLCNNQVKTITAKSANNIHKHDDLMKLGTLSLEDFCKPLISMPTSSPTSPSNIKFVPSKQTDSVSALNLYCDKYKYVKPEYFDCGKVGTTFVTKCVYQAFATKGTGLTTKFAKQESARQMLEMIGIKHDPDQPQPANETNLIDLNDNSLVKQPKAAKPLKLSPSVATPLDNNAVIEMYKKNTPLFVNDSVHNNEALQAFFDAMDDEPIGDQSYPELRKLLLKHKVKHDVQILQKHDPCIMGLSGKRLMNDGTVLQKHLVEMGDTQHEVLGLLLAKAITCFECNQIS